MIGRKEEHLTFCSEISDRPGGVRVAQQVVQVVSEHVVQAKV